MRERTPAMANMSACQAIGFIIGPGKCPCSVYGVYRNLKTFVIMVA